MQRLTRRQTLFGALFGSGMLGLRSLATGLPIAFLAKPLSALADGTCSASNIGSISTAYQYLVLSTSGFGDPLNANAPGSYVDGVVHPPDQGMTATPVTIGGKQVMAAKPWSTLDPEILARTSFFHHSTLTNSHANQNKVMKLMGATRRQEMMVSLFAQALAPILGTVQSEPVVIGAANSNELLSYQGRTLPKLSPSGLKDMLTNAASPLTTLQSLRDRDMNALNALLKQSGNSQQRAFLDAYANTQTEARDICQSLLDGLNGITGDDAPNQAIAAAVLVQMKVSPVISMHIPWGGDNHNDADLANESAQTQAGVTTMNGLYGLLKNAQLQDHVTFAQMNVFGRTLATKGTTGRDHLANHHVTVMFGKNLKSSVVGGLAPKAGDFGALPIDSTTGMGTDGGDIAFEDTLASCAQTLGKAVGVTGDLLTTDITSGKPVAAALNV